MASGLLDSRVDAMIDMLSPVNRLHPLNRGLVSWWLALPGTTGGARFMDIANPGPNGNHGVLTNMDPAADWVAGNRPGGWGALDFGLGGGYALAPQIDVARVTIGAWVETNALGSAAQDAISVEGDSWSLRPVEKVSGGRVNRPYFWVKVGGSYYAAFDTTVLTVGESYYVMATYDGENVRIYINGIEGDNSPNTSPSGDLDAPVGPTAIGVHAELVGNDWNGPLDSISVWNRALSADEGRWIYNLGKQGYPGLLNRIERRVFAEAAPPPAGFAHSQAVILA